MMGLRKSWNNKGERVSGRSYSYGPVEVEKERSR